MIKKIITFCKSLTLHFLRGFPKCTQKQIDDRMDICESCEMFDAINSQCLVCGCNLSRQKIFMNKLAWSDQQCPLNKWSKIQ
jgi:uncharacterized paraquat-inducible protein A